MKKSNKDTVIFGMSKSGAGASDNNIGQKCIPTVNKPNQYLKKIELL